jgi:hypothetical protein
VMNLMSTGRLEFEFEIEQLELNKIVLNNSVMRQLVEDDKIG